MRILNICIRDYAGLTIRLTDAINKHTQHEARQLIMAKHKWNYPYDIYSTDGEEIAEWVDWADIVNCWGNTRPLRGAKKVPERLIITHVGSYFRVAPEMRHREALRLGAKELVCTPDLLLYFEGMNWIPSAVPVDEWSKMRGEHVGKPIVCQSPSSLRRKNTAEILKQIRGKKNIATEIITRVDWEECMKRKSIADIYIGSYCQHYGVSSLEAWSMGIPVISHIESPEKEAHLQEIGYLPYYDAPIEELSEAIDTLLESKKTYRKYSELGCKYVKEFHDYPVVAERFTSFCEELTRDP